jgi:hypothetical protein
MIPPHHGPNFGTTSVMTTAVPLLEASLYKLGGCSVTSTRPLVNPMCSQPDGSNVATNQHSERPKLSSFADDTHTKPMAVTQRPTTLCKVSSQGVPPSGGERMSATKPSQSPHGNDTVQASQNPCTTMRGTPPQQLLLLETSKVSGHADKCGELVEGYKPFKQSTSTLAYDACLLSEAYSGNTSTSLDIASMVVNITTNANTNYVQEGSYAIEQQPVAPKATMPTAAQKAASPNGSQPYWECAPGTPAIHENGKQHHVASDHQDPNDLIPSDNTDGCTSADHQGKPALPEGNTTGSTLTEGHHASVNTSMYVLAQPYESAFLPLGHIPSNSCMPIWEPARDLQCLKPLCYAPCAGPENPVQWQKCLGRAHKLE